MKKIIVLVLALIIVTFAVAEGMTPQMFLMGRGLMVLDESQMSTPEDSSSDNGWMKDLDVVVLSLPSEGAAAIAFSDVAFGMASAFSGNTGSTNNSSIIQAFVDFCKAYEFDAYFAQTNESENAFCYAADVGKLAELAEGTGEEMPIENQCTSKDEFLEAVQTIDIQSLGSDSEGVDSSPETDTGEEPTVPQGDNTAAGSKAAENNSEPLVVYDKDGHRLTLTNMRAGNYSNYKLSVVFDAVYENNSDGTTRLEINGSFVNGWDTGALRSSDTTPGHKEKFDIVIGLDNTDLTSIEDIETIEFVFGYLYEDYHFEEFEPTVIYQK